MNGEWGPKIVHGGKPDYSPDEFYMESRDKKGFSSTLRCHVPPGLMQQITELVEGKQWPYRSKADVVRDAIVHLLKYRADHDPNEETRRRVDGLIAKERTMAVIEAREQFAEYVEKLEGALSRASQEDRVKIAGDAVMYARSLGEGFEGEMVAFLGGRGL